MNAAQMSVILLCGGQGTRMQSKLPKQFLKINEKMIALYSFDVFKQMPEVAEIVVVCEPDYQHYFSLNDLSIPLHFAPPGMRRQDSVYNGLQALRAKAPFTCVHDSARPFITPPIVRRVMHAAEEVGAASAGMPLKFTIKKHHGNHLVEETPDRSKYWEIQTPQIMRTDLLKKGFELIKQTNLEVTDDVSLVEALGLPVKLVAGCYTNFKITTPDDLELAKNGKQL